MSTDTQSDSEFKTRRWPPSAALAARLFGVLLAVAAGLKMFDLFDSWGEGIGWTLAVTAMTVELVVGAALMLRVWPSVTVPAGGILFVLLTAVSLMGTIRGVADCGCLGVVPMDPWVMLILDGAAAVALLKSVRRPGPQQRGPLGRLDVVCIGAFFFGLAMGSGIYPKVAPVTQSISTELIRYRHRFTVDPDRFHGQPFFLANFIRIDADLNHGEWTVIFTRPKCRKCDRMLRNGGCQPVGKERIAVVLPDESESHDGTSWTLPEGCRAVVGHLIPGKTWDYEPPVIFHVTDGKVTEAH